MRKVTRVLTSKMLLPALLATLAAGSLSATVVPCPTSTTMDVLIATFNSTANACSSQDKIFWNFNYVPGVNAPAASAVSANLIFQTGTVDIHGWNFGSTWSQNVASGALANFVLGYSVEVCPVGSPCAGAVAAGTNIFAADAVYAPSAVFVPGPETVNWSNGATATLTSGSPGPLPVGGNIGLPAGGLGQGVPISVTANFSGTGAITQTTLRFYERFATTIPEPTTFALLLGGIGLIGLGRWRRQKQM